MNNVKTEVIVNPLTETVELVNLSLLDDAKTLIEHTFANIDTLGKKADCSLILALSRIMTLSATEVRGILYGIKPSTAYGRAGLIGLKKLYGLRFVSNISRTTYTETILSGINNGYTFSSLVDLTWTLLSYSHGQEARENTMLSGHVVLNTTKPSMIDVNLLLKKHPSTELSFVDGLAEAFKLTFPAITKEDKNKFDKYVKAGTVEEVGKLSQERNKVSAREHDLEARLAKFEQDKSDFEKVKENHSGTDAYNIVKTENGNLKTQLEGLASVNEELEASQSRENALVLEAESKAEANIKLIEATEKRVKKKYQSKADAQLEKLRADMYLKAETAAKLSEAKKEAESEPTLPTLEKRECQNCDCEVCETCEGQCSCDCPCNCHDIEDDETLTISDVLVRISQETDEDAISLKNKTRLIFELSNLSEKSKFIGAAEPTWVNWENFLECLTDEVTEINFTSSSEHNSEKLAQSMVVISQKEAQIKDLEVKQLESDNRNARQTNMIKNLDDKVQSFAAPADKLIVVDATLDDLREKIEAVTLSSVKTKAGLAEVKKMLIQVLLEAKTSSKSEV